MVNVSKDTTLSEWIRLKTVKTSSKQYTKESTKPVIFVLLACSYFIDPRVKQEVNTLTKRGFYVHVLSWDREGKYSDMETKNSCVKTVRLLTSSSFSKVLFMLSAVLFQFVIFFSGIKLLRKHGRIIVHINDFNTILGAVWLKQLYKKRVKLVYDSHELTPAVYGEWYGAFFGSIIGKIEHRFMQYMDALITVSPPIVRHLSGLTDHKVHLVWNYPSREIVSSLSKQQARKQLQIPKDGFVIVYVGSLRLDIALLQLVDAVKAIQKNNPSMIATTKVYIIGDGPLFEPLKEKIKEHHLEEKVQLVGRVEREKSLTYLRAADLSYILFTVKGLNTQIGMPWKLFESLVSGTRVVVVGGTYAAKMVLENNAGYTTTSIGTAEITKTLGAVIEEGTKPPLDLADKFVWEAQEETIVAIYKALLWK